jgi:hypothetical protein
MPPSFPDPLDATALHALLLQLFLQQEDERNMVGRALHNQVGQTLSAIRMTAHLTQDESDPAQRREDLQDIMRASDDAVAVLRDLHATLHPPQLDALGLEASLRAEMERIAAQTGPVEIALASLPRPPDTAVARVAFRIAQSLARQAARHAATQLSLAEDPHTTPSAFGLSVHCGSHPVLDDLALLQALAASVGGALSEQATEHGVHWQLRLPYAATPRLPRDRP